MDGSPSSAPVISVRGLTKRYSSTVLAVDDLTFTVEPGQVCGMLGPNGAGKTTTMRVLLDLPLRGCAADARYVDEHPDWLCYDETGAIVHAPGHSALVRFDWANRSLQDHMLGWALEWLRSCRLDGYRAIAPRARLPNWAKRLPYHTGASAIGVVRLLDRLRAALEAATHAVVPNSDRFTNVESMTFGTGVDIIYQGSERPEAHDARFAQGSVTLSFSDMERLTPGQRPGKGVRFTDVSLGLGVKGGMASYNGGVNLSIGRTTDPQAQTRDPNLETIAQLVRDGRPITPVLSEKDAAAPGLDEVEALGVLPRFEDVCAFVADLRG